MAPFLRRPLLLEPLALAIFNYRLPLSRPGRSPRRSRSLLKVRAPKLLGCPPQLYSGEGIQRLGTIQALLPYLRLLDV